MVTSWPSTSIGENETASYATPVKQDCAGSAVAAIAAGFGALDTQPVAEHIEEHVVGIHRQRAGFAVQHEGDISSWEPPEGDRAAGMKSPRRLSQSALQHHARHVAPVCGGRHAYP